MPGWKLTGDKTRLTYEAATPTKIKKVDINKFHKISIQFLDEKNSEDYQKISNLIKHGKPCTYTGQSPGTINYEFWYTVDESADTEIGKITDMIDQIEPLGEPNEWLALVSDFRIPMIDYLCRYADKNPEKAIALIGKFHRTQYQQAVKKLFDFFVEKKSIEHALQLWELCYSSIEEEPLAHELTTVLYDQVKHHQDADAISQKQRLFIKLEPVTYIGFTSERIKQINEMRNKIFHDLSGEVGEEISLQYRQEALIAIAKRMREWSSQPGLALSTDNLVGPKDAKAAEVIPNNATAALARTLGLHVQPLSSSTTNMQPQLHVPAQRPNGGFS